MKHLAIRITVLLTLILASPVASYSQAYVMNLPGQGISDEPACDHSITQDGSEEDFIDQANSRSVPCDQQPVGISREFNPFFPANDAGTIWQPPKSL
jgi:hypothetical protein